MRLLGKPIPEIIASDLTVLLETEAAEDATLEFKRDLPLEVGQIEDPVKRQAALAKARSEFLCDASALANTRGGTIVFGIEQREGGIADKITGLGSINESAEKLRLEQTLESGIQPPIRGHDIRVVKHPDGYVLLLGLPSSIAGPHMVVGPLKLHQFYGRNSGGKYPMDAYQVRQAVLATSNWGREAESYVQERLEFARRITGVDFGGGLLFVHVLPLGRLRDRANLLAASPPLGNQFHANVGKSRWNVDGLVIPYPKGTRPLQYVQVFGHGGVEACVSMADLSVVHEGHRIVNGRNLNATLTDLLGIALRCPASVSVDPPFAVSLSVMGGSGVRFARSADPSAERYSAEIDRDRALIPAVVVESSPVDPTPPTKALLDLLWQTAGWPKSPTDSDSRESLGCAGTILEDV